MTSKYRNSAIRDWATTTPTSGHDGSPRIARSEAPLRKPVRFSSDFSEGSLAAAYAGFLTSECWLKGA